MSKWTPKGKPRDGYYYKGKCSIHGTTDVVSIGKGGCKIIRT